MDHLALPPPAVKRRRSYTDEFRAKVVQASYEPGQSVAGVAQHYQINANMLHRWRKRFEASGNRKSSEFVEFPVSSRRFAPISEAGQVRIELPGGVVIYWPVTHMPSSVVWLKAIMTP